MQVYLAAFAEQGRPLSASCTTQRTSRCQLRHSAGAPLLSSCGLLRLEVAMSATVCPASRHRYDQTDKAPKKDFALIADVACSRGVPTVDWSVATPPLQLAGCARGARSGTALSCCVRGCRPPTLRDQLDDSKIGHGAPEAVERKATL